jgi:hypothetical protein
MLETFALKWQGLNIQLHEGMNLYSEERVTLRIPAVSDLLFAPGMLRCR